MNIAFVSTRLAGTDGVSLETRKWATILRRLGHRVCFCAGELDHDLYGFQLPEMHFVHPQVQWIQERCFGTAQASPELFTQIESLSGFLCEQLRSFIRAFQLDMLVVENALAIPMNVALGVALARVIHEEHMPTIAHHHDFVWERERFQINCIPHILEQTFPPMAPSIRHVVINTPAQRSLKEQRGLDSVVIANIFDFAQAAPGIGAYSRDLRAELGLSQDHLIILQPTRVIRRKGIELSMELLRRLQAPELKPRLLYKEPVLVITHRADDEGLDYLTELQRQVQTMGVHLIYAATYFGSSAMCTSAHKVYSLWDGYTHADFVTYPSRYEGFGNALLEAIYFRLPILVNRYQVYVADIAPLGFDLVEIDGAITDEIVEQVICAVMDPVRRREMVEYNYQLAHDHYSYEAVMPQLEVLLH